MPQVAPKQILPGTSGQILKTNASGLSIFETIPRSIFMPAAAMWPSTSSGCAALAKVEFGTNDIDLQLLDFDQTTQEYAQFGVVMPENWNASTVTFKAIWTAASGTLTNGVAWELQGRAFADDDPIDAAWGTVQKIVDNLIALGDIHESGESPAITLAGTPAAGQFAQFRIGRNTGDAGDDLDADARLIGLRINYVAL